MEPLLNSLNPAQKEAAETIDKHVRIIAGAGSGKTRVLMARIEYLLNEVGVFPNRILAITFTNKAANEMKERLEAQVGDLARDVRISTIHALCVRILKEDASAIGYPRNFTIMDPEDQKAILKPIYKDLGIDKTSLSMSAALSMISKYKTSGTSPEDAKKETYYGEYEKFPEIYRRYEEARADMKAMDFDDLLIEADRLLSENEQVRNKWQNRIDYLHVDEFQDVDPIQYDIIKRLTRKDAVLCVVGDPDQTIYTWRGAEVSIILNFTKDFTPSHTVILEENYRSTTPILEASNALVSNNRSRIKKNLKTSLPGDDLLVMHQSERETDEAIFVARQMQDLHKKGIPYGDMAILYRANYCSRVFEKTLRSINVPYQIYGGTRFYERQEIKDILSYLKLLTKPDEDDERHKSLDLAMLRVINTPRRGIGARTVEKMVEEGALRDLNLLEVAGHPTSISAAAEKKILKFYDTIQDLKKEKENLSLPDLIDVILDYTDYRTMLTEAKEPERLENIEELKRDIAQSVEENPDLTLEEYLQDIALFTDKSEDPTASSGIKLMTAHASKGTEYPVVFIVNMNEGVFPSKRALDDGGSRGLEEERRLLYVAMTRAKKRLFLSWNRDTNFYTQVPRTPSRFIQEIPKDYVEAEKVEEPVHPKRQSISITSRHKQAPRKTGRTKHYRKGDLVDHNIYGEGVIISLDGDVANIAFGHTIGVKKINVTHPSITPKKKGA